MSKQYIRVDGRKGYHEVVKVYIAKSGRTLVDYRDTKKYVLRTVAVEDARMLCPACTKRVVALKTPRSKCPDCE